MGLDVGDGFRPKMKGRTKLTGDRRNGRTSSGRIKLDGIDNLFDRLIPDFPVHVSNESVDFQVAAE